MSCSSTLEIGLLYQGFVYSYLFMSDIPSEDQKIPGSIPSTGVPVPPEPPMSPMTPSQSTGASLVDSLINQNPPQSAQPENNQVFSVGSTSNGNKGKPKKHSSLGVMLAGVLILMVTLPIGIYFISQQNTRLTEQRSCAATPGEPGCPDPDGPYPNITVPPGFTCHEASCCHQYKNKTCVMSGGECLCTAYDAEGCGPWGACHNDTCKCIQERYCNNNEYQITSCSGCGGCHETPKPPGPTEPPQPPQSTPTTAPGQCSDIRVYKDGVRKDLTTVHHGDVLEIAVTGEKATKARIRVNSGGWTVTDVKNASGEYRISFTVPEDTATFTVEAEIFDSATSVWK
jgi:hypothetical protein